jgi:hypothetical protein
LKSSSSVRVMVLVMLVQWFLHQYDRPVTFLLWQG